MCASEDAKRVAAAATRLYGSGQRVWDPSDRWNERKRLEIDQFAQHSVAKTLSTAAVILDVGCGSQPYAWVPSHTICIDRFLEQVRSRNFAVVGDIVQLPFDRAIADYVICVASVINYVPAAEALSELGRVLRIGGRLLLHFETSTSFEHFGSRKWGMTAVQINTFNAGREDTIWVYRPSYIHALLKNFGFRTLACHRFHTASALALRMGFSQQKAARFAAFDKLFRLLSALSDDVILIAEKVSAGIGEVEDES